MAAGQYRDPPDRLPMRSRHCRCTPPEQTSPAILLTAVGAASLVAPADPVATERTEPGGCRADLQQTGPQAFQGTGHQDHAEQIAVGGRPVDPATGGFLCSQGLAGGVDQILPVSSQIVGSDLATGEQRSALADIPDLIRRPLRDAAAIDIWIVLNVLAIVVHVDDAVIVGIAGDLPFDQRIIPLPRSARVITAPRHTRGNAACGDAPMTGQGRLLAIHIQGG